MKGAVRLLDGRRPAGAAAGLLGVLVATYTAVLLSDTATPSWHEGRREMPFVFAGSAAAAAGGLGLLGAPLAESGPARQMATVGALTEVLMTRRMAQSMGITAEPLSRARGAVLDRQQSLHRPRSECCCRVTRRRSLLRPRGSTARRFALHPSRDLRSGAGLRARDPRYTVVPQRQRLADASRATPD